MISFFVSWDKNWEKYTRKDTLILSLEQWCKIDSNQCCCVVTRENISGWWDGACCNARKQTSVSPLLKPKLRHFPIKTPEKKFTHVKNSKTGVKFRFLWVSPFIKMTFSLNLYIWYWYSESMGQETLEGAKSAAISIDFTQWTRNDFYLKSIVLNQYSSVKVFKLYSLAFLYKIWSSLTSWSQPAPKGMLWPWKSTFFTLPPM